MRLSLLLVTAILLAPATADAQAIKSVEYKLLATSRTGTMEKEMNQASEAGFHFETMTGGETAFGGKETVTIMSRTGKGGRYRYKLLATSRTSTMEKEIQQAAEDGFEYRGQAVFESLLGGKEVVVIMELNKDQPSLGWQYRLLATSKTGTMEKELNDVGDVGYQIVGTTVGQTLMGGKELVAIVRRKK